MSSSSNIYVGNLPPSATEQFLNQLFQTFGAVTSCKVLRDPVSKMSRGAGLVQFANATSATNAVQQMNGFQVEGCSLSVKYANNDVGTRSAPALPINGCTPNDNIFVANLPTEWTQTELNAFFGTYGAVTSSIILKDKLTGQPKGTALVRYADINSAATAVNTVNGFTLPHASKPLEVRFADMSQKLPKPAGFPVAASRFQAYPQTLVAPTHMSVGGRMAPGASLPVGSSFLPKAPIAPEDDTNLYIRGLESALDDVHLYQTFSPYGAVNSVRVIKDNVTGASKGYGFVQFMRRDDAQRAMAALNGASVLGREWSVTPHTKKVESS